MYAEVKIRAKKKLPRDLGGALAEHFPSEAGPEDVVAATVYAGDPDNRDRYVAGLAHAQLVGGRASLFYLESAGALRVHIQHVDPRTSLGGLGEHAGDVVSDIESLLKGRRTWRRAARAPWTEVEALRVNTVAEGLRIETRERTRWHERLAKSFQTEWLQKAYVPLATVVGTWWVGGNLDLYIRNFVIALVALAIWVVLAATFVMDRYEVRTVKE